jgi:hypothetical protein
VKVLVCDDRTNRSQDVVDAIAEADQRSIGVVQLKERELTEELEALFEHVNRCLANPKNCEAESGLSFDTADLVILDNNLAHLDFKGARLTAESIAGYIRAFTEARYIISLNKNPDVDFDLRYLVGDYATRADLALNTNHLANRALWTRKHNDAKGGFLPWYWPQLTTVWRRRQEQIAFVLAHLNDRVFGALGFPKSDVIPFLSLHAIGALSPFAESNGQTGGDSVPIDEVTFRDVFDASSRALPAADDRKKLSNAAKSGSRGARKIVSRVIAADIDLWFRRDVLGPQEALVDVPHLLMRMPFLLGDRAVDIKRWNKTVTATAPPFGLKPVLFKNHLAPLMFQHSMWVPSACFWWPKLKADEKLNQVFFQSKQDTWLDAVFCEDCSAFCKRAERTDCELSEFSAEFEGSWGRRNVARIDSIHYAPRSRFAV